MKLRTGRMMFLAAFVMLLSVSVHAQTDKTAKALWCAGNTTLYLTYDSNTYNVGDIYDGQTITNVYLTTGDIQHDPKDNPVPWDPIKGSVTNVVVNSNFSIFKPRHLSCWFHGFSKATFTGLNYINTSDVRTLYHTFRNCNALTSLEGIKNWDTSKVTTLNHAFGSCWGLTSLEPIKDWNTSSVTDMNNTFSNCTYLTSLEGIKNWDTHNVTLMSGTFASCFKLTSLEGIKNWDTHNVTTMSAIFHACSSLTSLEPIKDWDTRNVTNISLIFGACLNLTSLEPIKNWDTSNVTTMSQAFYNCQKLTLVDLSGWDTGNVTNMTGLFMNCKRLRGITFGENFKMNKVSNAINMFSGCNKLRYIDFYKSNYATSGSGLQFPLNTADRTAGVFNGVPETTVIFLPKKNRLVTNVTNVVYSYNGDASDLRCPKYYSIDKVDIEFPHSFKTNEAVYLRDMTGKQYGSVTLPYEFTTNSDIQAYSLSKQEMKNGSVNRLTFTDVASVPAHTPFAFKRLNSNPQSTEFLMKDNSGNFGIIVNATRSTNAAEKTWTSAGPDATIGSPYIGSTGLSNWKTKGYYVKETVTDYDGMYFIQNNEFKRAVGNLNLVDHRVLFYPTDNTTAKFFSLSFSDDEVITAIEAAETEKTLREATAIYDATGRRQVAVKKGLNIVRMSDGTVRKVIVK